MLKIMQNSVKIFKYKMVSAIMQNDDRTCLEDGTKCNRSKTAISAAPVMNIGRFSIRKPDDATKNRERTDGIKCSTI